MHPGDLHLVVGRQVDRRGPDPQRRRSWQAGVRRGGNEQRQKDRG